MALMQAARDMGIAKSDGSCLTASWFHVKTCTHVTLNRELGWTSQASANVLKRPSKSARGYKVQLTYTATNEGLDLPYNWEQQISLGRHSEDHYYR